MAAKTCTGASLERLHAAYHAHVASGGSQQGPLLVDGCPLEDLCLTWELPAYPHYPLLPPSLHPGGGADVRRRCAALRCAALCW